MRSLLYATTTMTFLVAGHLSPAMADGPKASDGNTWAGRALVSDTPVRTAAASPPVAHQSRSNAPPLYELDPEVQRLFDEIMRRAGVPLSELR
jgi:hypothetical protein